MPFEKNILRLVEQSQIKKFNAMFLSHQTGHDCPIQQLLKFRKILIMSLDLKGEV